MYPRNMVCFKYIIVNNLHKVINNNNNNNNNNSPVEPELIGIEKWGLGVQVGTPCLTF